MCASTMGMTDWGLYACVYVCVGGDGRDDGGDRDSEGVLLLLFLLPEREGWGEGEGEEEEEGGGQGEGTVKVGIDGVSDCL